MTWGLMSIIPVLLFVSLLTTPEITLAQTQHPTSYTTIVGLPGVEENAGFDALINGLYALSISIAALLAVIKIIVAGVKWMTSDIVTSKESAKKDISGALFGLVVVLASVLILTVINKDIIEVDLTFGDVRNNFIGGSGSGGGSSSGGNNSGALYTAETRGDTLKVLSEDATNSQVNAFKNECIENGDYFDMDLTGTSPRCIILNNNQNANVYTRNTKTSTGEIDKNLEDQYKKDCADRAGEFKTDAKDITYSYCIYPKR
jgi:hypothetical protein